MRSSVPCRYFFITSFLVLSACSTIPENKVAVNTDVSLPQAADTATPIPDANESIPVIKWTDIKVASPAPPQNIWQHLTRGFSLPSVDNTRVTGERNWYATHASYVERVAERAKPYIYYIVKSVESRNMPLDIALLPVVESAYDPFAYSNGRAAGLWQFIPGTGRRFDLKQDWWYDGRRDIGASTRAALDYLQYLHDQFHGDWLLALAAYNSGSGTVQRAINYNHRHNRLGDFWHLNLPAETRAYVPRLLAIRDIIADPARYHITLPDIPDSPYLARVNVGGQIDLAKAAQLAGISLQQMYLLNPGFNRWATDPSGPNTLFVPVDKKSLFTQAVANLPPSKRIHWIRHRIRPGDTLGGIARRYHTTVAVLQRTNGIHGRIIRVGAYLMVPESVRSLAAYTLTANQRRAAIQHIPRRGRKTRYTVRAGDTLWTISRHYKVGIKSLAHWNGMAPADTLKVGQVLVVWHKGVVHGRGGPPHRLRTVYYTVRRGDSLAKISSRFNVSVNEVANWNSLNPDDYLQPGQKLKLYVDITTQSTSS